VGCAADGRGQAVALQRLGVDVHGEAGWFG
jgi:hypothetical protein